jgi:hypothetical protein
MATAVSARSPGCPDHRAHGASGRQNHRGGLGDRARDAICHRQAQRHRLSVSASECRSKAILVEVGAKLKTDNVYALELDNGTRVLALPGSDDSIRGLTVDGWIVADEAARLRESMIAALRPMRMRWPQARFAMLSTAWSRTDPFWTVWDNGDPSWIRLKATADVCGFYSAAQLEQERKALGEAAFNREFLGIPAGDNISPFSRDLYENAVKVRVPLVPAGRAFSPQPAPPVPAANPFQSFRVRAFR